MKPLAIHKAPRYHQALGSVWMKGKGNPPKTPLGHGLQNIAWNKIKEISHVWFEIVYHIIFN